MKSCIQEIHRKFSKNGGDKEQITYFTERDIYELPTQALVNKILDNPDLV